MSEPFALSMIIAPAFLAGALLSAVHVPLGIEVLRRGIIFLDLAVAQFAALGMIAFHVHFEDYGIGPDDAIFGGVLAGLGMALLCAFVLHYLEKRAGRYQEALIGSAFVFAASLSILVMSGDPHSGERMRDVLAGQILWTTWRDLINYGPIFLIVLATWWLIKAQRQRMFYLLFAVTIPFSVKLIGVYLVFASLILPALSTIHVDRYRCLTGYLLSAFSFAAGLAFSYYQDLPSGPSIVITMFATSFIFYILKSKNDPTSAA